MQNIAQYLTKTNQPLQSLKSVTKTSSKETTKIPEWVDIIFARFSVIYGDYWAGNTTEIIKMRQQEWAKTTALSAFMTNEIANKSIDKCKEEFDRPPTIAKFVEISKIFKPQNFYSALNHSPQIGNVSYGEYYNMMSRKYPEKKHLLVRPDEANAIIQEAKNSKINEKKDISEIIIYIQSKILNKKK